MFKASAPGSLMLLGEYAVLHGHHALVVAIDKRIRVTLIPRDDACIILDSVLGHYETTLSHLESVIPFQFVLAALHSFKKYLRRGCHIRIESEFSDTVGFASSAAVTVATLRALSEWLGKPFSITEQIKQARKVVHHVQGIGSGADVSASVLGGIVFYRMKPFVAKSLPVLHPITVVYSGYKTPTPIAIQHVQKNFSTLPTIFSELMKAINACSVQGLAAIHQNDWKKMGNIMNIQQGLMEALGVNTTEMNRIVALLREQSDVLGAKISGSGLGDCVVALGESSLAESLLSAWGAKQIKVSMSEEGVRCEKI